MRTGKTPGKGESLKNADYLVWRVMKGKKQQHDQEITRLYNMRARHRVETRH